MDNVALKFKYCMIVTSDNLDEVFSNYDHHEKFDEKVNYPDQPFLEQYGRGVISRYVPELIIVRCIEGHEYYVGYRRMITELDRLVDHCQCSLCRGVYFAHLFGCRTCYRCLKGGITVARSCDIEMARKHANGELTTKGDDMNRFVISLCICVISATVAYMYTVF